MAVKLTTYDPAEDLTSDAAIATFMADAFATEDAGYIAHALGVVARAKGMAQIAERAGLSREQLYRSLTHVPGVEPVTVGLFGGAIVPETLHFPFSHMPAGDLRDWDAVRDWADRLPDALGLAVRVA